MEGKIKCNFCRSQKFRILFSARDKSFWIPRNFGLVKCKNCGLIAINPIPKKKELEKYYPRGYYSYEKIDSDSLKLRIKMLLYNLYFSKKNKNFFLRFVFLPLLPFSRGTVISPGKKLLDIGCGSGQFLYEMKQFGMKAYGIEPGKFDKQSAEGHGINIKNTDLFKAKYSNDFFDIITVNHVLEHVHNPISVIGEIYRILKKNGKIIVGVPNFRSLASFLFGKNWYQLDVPRHLYNFSDKILVKKLKEERFKIEKIRYNSRPEQFTVSLFYSFNINYKKHPVITAILNMLFLPLTYAVNMMKIGDQIEIYCSK